VSKFVPKTPAEVRAEFDAQGVSIASFARSHNLKVSTVYQVLAGTKQGRRGEAHRAAVLLGLKKGFRAEAGTLR